MPSSIPDTKALIKTRLTTALPADVLISRGDPAPTAAGRRSVIIGKAESTQQPTQLGTTAREESYTLELVVTVAPTTLEAYSVIETEAYDIVADIEADLLAWQAAGFTGLNGWATVESMTDSEVLTLAQDGSVTGRKASVSVLVAVTTRL